jgi:Gene product 88
MGISLSKGNAKLVKTSGEEYRVIGFGIPADHNFQDSSGQTVNTCPGATACRSVCYAKQGRYLMPNVMAARQDNLAESLKETFVEDMIKALTSARSYNVIRIHDSGDFYNQTYLDKWSAIAAALPGKIFYAYTKAHHLSFSNVPANLRIVRSLGGRWDKLVDLTQSHSRIFASEQARIDAGYVDGNVNDIPAIEGVNKIGLVYHGTKKLTAAQQAYWV